MALSWCIPEKEKVAISDVCTALKVIVGFSLNICYYHLSRIPLVGFVSIVVLYRYLLHICRLLYALNVYVSVNYSCTCQRVHFRFITALHAYQIVIGCFWYSCMCYLEWMEISVSMPYLMSQSSVLCSPWICCKTRPILFPGQRRTLRWSQGLSIYFYFLL